MPVPSDSRLKLHQLRCAQAEWGDGQLVVPCHVHVLPGRPRAVAEDRSAAHVSPRCCYVTSSVCSASSLNAYVQLGLVPPRPMSLLCPAVLTVSPP